MIQALQEAARHLTMPPDWRASPQLGDRLSFCFMLCMFVLLPQRFHFLDL
jgi:hypothetical protein